MLLIIDSLFILQFHLPTTQIVAAAICSIDLQVAASVCLVYRLI